MKTFYFSVLIFSVSLLSCYKSDDYEPILPDISERALSGGATTLYETGAFSFNNPAPNLSGENLKNHLKGDKLFEANFVAAPARLNAGLGVQYNNVSCEACHPKDGRARFPDKINAFSGFFLRISLPGTDAHGAPLPVPGFGDQLQNHALVGYEPEVQFGVRYEPIIIDFSDGSRVTLQKPIYSIPQSYIPIPPQALFSPRIGPPVFGLGLLEAIPEQDILAREDVNDANADGISGKANRVWDVQSQSTKLGRFGWKANAPSVMAQIAGAYHGDMGITSPLFPQEADFGQTNGSATNPAEPEIPQTTLDLVTLYCQTLAVPAARNLHDTQVRRGAALFEEAQCHLCHVPQQRTGTVAGIPEISNQTFYPYTDMLLHDMGEYLADGRPDFLADGNEWKTRPLWGIGLTKNVNGHTHFLHDGRAKSVEEAILFHAGEAKKSQEFYRKLPKKDREALLKFVESL